MAFLAHERLGEGFGTVYDVATIGILWFAGASAMAGLLNIVPRYLPRYGIAPEWARSTRPLVVLFTLVAAVVTIVFQASVDRQAGAYATGVLALMSSAAFAVFLTEARRRHRGAAVGFLVVTLIFVYTSVVTISERPEGLWIAAIFIGTIIFFSVLSRISRSTELRVKRVILEPQAEAIFARWAAAHPGPLRFIANKLDAATGPSTTRRTTTSGPRRTWAPTTRPSSSRWRSRTPASSPATWWSVASSSPNRIPPGVPWCTSAVEPSGPPRSLSPARAGRSVSVHVSPARVRSASA